MATVADCRRVERRMRDLLAAEGLSQPDEVEYRETEIVLLWHETKLAVVIEIDERPE